MLVSDSSCGHGYERTAGGRVPLLNKANDVGRIIQITGVGVWHPTKHTLRIVRVGMCRYAEEFYRAALKTRSLPVRAHLLGHALELYLKTYLLNRGIKLAMLKRQPYGHNIARLLDACIEHDLGKDFRISPELIAEIRSFSIVYTSKGLEYFSPLFLLAPPKLTRLDRIRRFIAQLDAKMLKSVQNST
jgi:hypothetical protein